MDSAYYTRISSNNNNLQLKIVLNLNTTQGNNRCTEIQILLVVGNTKKKLAENKRESRWTGVGPPPNAVSPVEEKVAGIIGKTPINGIEGGIDTCENAAFEKQVGCTSLPSSEKSKRLSSSSSSIKQAFPTGDMPSLSKVAKLNIPTKKFQTENETLRLIEIENERLKVEKERLQIEKSRYEVEQERYKLKMQKLEIEREKLVMEKGRQLSIMAAGPVDNRNMQYDNLSESRNTLNYSTLNRTSTDMDDQQKQKDIETEEKIQALSYKHIRTQIIRIEYLYQGNAIGPVEEKVAGIIGKTPINGIEGGIDTCENAAFEEQVGCTSLPSSEKSKRLSSSSSSIEQGM
ncbi:unnamed protein product [Mytilus coruscus]|uniref:Uncharacterized protein n=1 Tax=Mytilus coruscus TaxID=42192 RepID=A0A6J8AFR4_MYTCO|nr:unnamed protein product [Mytilus coruscus]